MVFAPRVWWFPERDGSAYLSNPFGCLESNVNVLTSVDVEDCDPMGGSWANRGLMCRVYKCTELDHDYKPADAQWSIPGNAAEPGVTVMPSDQKMARPHVPFEAPEVEEAPEGFYRVCQDGQLYQEGTHFRLDESGWLVNPRTKGYHDAYTGWRYDPASELLVDDATGKSYTMDREEVSFLGGVRCYPGAEAPFEVPEQLTRTSPTCTIPPPAGSSIPRPAPSTTPTTAGSTTMPRGTWSTRRRARTTTWSTTRSSTKRPRPPVSPRKRKEPKL